MPARHPSGRRDLLDIKEAAEYLGRHVSFVRRLVARREVAYYKPGRAVRFDRDDLPGGAVAAAASRLIHTALRRTEWRDTVR